MADASGATVICLQSHPVWLAAKRRERQRKESMGRHPASLGRRRAAARRSEASVGVRNFTVCHGADEPA